MVFVSVVFGFLGVLLILLGWWGTRRNERLGVVPGWDERSIERRSATLRRGAYACIGAGVMFIVLAIVSLVYRPDTTNCPPNSVQCVAECSATYQCEFPRPKS